MNEYFTKLQNRFGSPRGILITTLLAAFILLIAVTVFQRQCDRRQAQKTDAEAEKLDRRAEVSSGEFDRNLELFKDRQRETAAIVEAMSAISKNIVLLTENDRRHDRQINDLSKEYYDARNQKSNQSKSSKNRGVRVNRSAADLLRRENELLASDRELYPGDDESSNERQ